MNNYKNNTVKVSVFCITYNQEKYIKQALDSFLNQKTTFSFEIIVHDDASTDFTPNIIREYQLKYPDIIVPIIESHNQYSKSGIEFIKTRMIPLCRGQFVAFCEGDDFWIDENKLQKQYDAIINNPTVSLVVGKVVGCKENGEAVDVECPSTDLNFNKTGLFSREIIGNLIAEARYPFQTSCFFASKELFEKCCEREFLKYTNGDETILREAVIEGDFYYISESLSCRRINSIGSFSLRKRRWPKKEKKKKILYHQYANMLFDIYTNGAYRTKIRERIVLDFTCGYIDKKIFNKIRSFYEVKAFEIRKKAGFKKFIIYVFSLFMPHLLRLLDRIH